MSVKTLDAVGRWNEQFTATEAWVCPPGVLQVYQCHLWAGGGRGGNGNVTGARGGGAGGGAYSRQDAIAVVPGQSYTVNVGQGGAVVGQNGADSWFSTTGTALAKGGLAGASGSGINTHGNGGLGGAAASGVGFSRFSGGNGAGGSDAGGGGGGGGSGNASNGNAAVVLTGGAANGRGGKGGNGASIDNGLPGEVLGGGAAGGGGVVGVTGGNGARGEVVLIYVEVGNLATVTAPAQKETIIEPPGTSISLAAYAAAEALADAGTDSSLAAFSGAEALAEAQLVTTLAALAQSEALAETTDLATLVALAQSEALIDQGALDTLALFVQSEALADAGGLTTLALLDALEALADLGSFTTVLVPSANWQRISPGLGGVAYDESGTTPIVGAQVLIFRDDTNTLVATLTSDASGAWSLGAPPIDPVLTYWISYWLDGATQIEDETDRHIEPVLTVVETGT